MVKVFYTNNFSEVINNTPVPVFSIGAEKLNTDLDVLKKAYDTIDAGARGIIFGRNIFMTKNPSKIVAALNDVINAGLKPEDVIAKYGLV